MSLQWYYKLRTELLLRNIVTGRVVEAMLMARVWVDREAFPRILKLIDRAEHTILIRMFIWKDDAMGRLMAEVITEAADRGVRVEIVKEFIGDALELDKDFGTTKNSEDSVWHRFWNHPNVKIHHERHDDHAKVYIFDGEVLLLTGMNIANEYHDEWHDYLVELRGRNFVNQYLTYGDQRDTHTWARLYMNTHERRDIRTTVTSLLENARDTIVVEHCYLSDPLVIDLLIKKSHDRVRVTVIVPEKPNHSKHSNMQAISRLITEGDRGHMEVFLYPGMFHGKMILVDRDTAFIGSANLIPTSLDTIGEVNVLLRGNFQRAIIKIRDTLRGDILKSNPLTNPPEFSWLGRWLAVLYFFYYLYFFYFLSLNQ